MSTTARTTANAPPSTERYVGRFAPSPTGPLHIGSLIAAVASYLDARANKGHWLLRIEDVDETRCQPAFAHDIVSTLGAFGLLWDGDIVTQSRQKSHYESALATLNEAGHLYGCECSRREVADSGQIGIDGPVYPGTCRRKRLPLDGMAVRFKLGDGKTHFTDRRQGTQSQDLSRAVGDFVIRRRDQLFSYQLAVVVDDYLSNVTDIVRGADLLDSTARQIALQRALGYPTPRYLHFPVASNSDGDKLSKQTLAAPVATGDRLGVLRGVLHFLRQPEVHRAADCQQLLAAAAANWRPEAIPQIRSLVFSGGA
jgi:glutamyl-Q tRNA(Asp) synthetase